MANASVEYDEKMLDQNKIEQFVKEAGFKSLGEFQDINIESKFTIIFINIYQELLNWLL